METKQHTTKNHLVNGEIKEEIRKYLKTNESGNKPSQNPWDASKAVPRGKFIVKQAFLKKQEKSLKNNLTYHLKELEEQTKPKVSRRREIIKIREEINKIELKKKPRKDQ